MIRLRFRYRLAERDIVVSVAGRSTLVTVGVLTADGNDASWKKR